MPSAKEDVVDPCPGLDACPLLLPSSLGRGQDDVCGVVPSLTQTPPLRPCKKLRLTAEHDVVDPWQGLVVIEERKTQPGVLASSSPKTGCTDTDNSIAWDYSGSSSGDFTRDDSAIAINDYEIVPGTQPKTYFVGRKGENEWRMPDLYIYNKIVS